MTFRQRILVGILALIAALGISLATAAPAQAVQYGSVKVCNSSDGYHSIQVFYTDGTLIGGFRRYALYPTGACTGYLWPAGLRVDTSPDNSADSYKIKPIGTGASDSYGPCHELVNHSSDPPQSSDGYSWVVYYKNYNGGSC